MLTTIHILALPKEYRWSTRHLSAVTHCRGAKWRLWKEWVCAREGGIEREQWPQLNYSRYMTRHGGRTREGRGAVDGRRCMTHVWKATRSRGHARYGARRHLVRRVRLRDAEFMCVYLFSSAEEIQWQWQNISKKKKRLVNRCESKERQLEQGSEYVAQELLIWCRCFHPEGGNVYVNLVFFSFIWKRGSPKPKGRRKRAHSGCFIPFTLP